MHAEKQGHGCFLICKEESDLVFRGKGKHDIQLVNALADPDLKISVVVIHQRPDAEHPEAVMMFVRIGRLRKAILELHVPVKIVFTVDEGKSAFFFQP